jgi:hypothetical protein
LTGTTSNERSTGLQQVNPADRQPRQRSKCERCGRVSDEPIRFDWGRTWAPWMCGTGVDFYFERDLTGRPVGPAIQARRG